MDDFMDNDLSSLSQTFQDLKIELDSLEKIEQRCKLIDDLFRQVALASRLKAELSVCSTERSIPIVCLVKLRQLSVGKCLVLINLKNNCKESLIGWHLVVQFYCLQNQLLLNFDPNIVHPKSTVTMSQLIPLLKDGCSIDLDLYCQEKLQLPTFVKCYLARTFSYNCPKTVGMQRKSFQICIHSSISTVLDAVRSKVDETFVMPLVKTPSLNSMEVQESRYCFSYAVLKVLRKSDFDTNFRNNAEFLLKWLFPNVTTLVTSGKEEGKLKFIDMNLDSNISICITFQISKNDEIHMVLQLTGEGSNAMMKVVKASILIKYLHLINNILNVPKTVDVDVSAISFALEHIRNDSTQQNIDNLLIQLSETVLWKLPLV